MFEPVMISALCSILMTFVWIVYLHIALVQYRRTNRPFLIIQHAHDDDPKALCFFVNMSKEPVHVLCVLAHIQGDKGNIHRNITDYDRVTPDDHNVQQRLRQGPIQPGGYLALGSFEEIILGKRSGPDDGEDSTHLLSTLHGINNLEICIALVHGPSRHHIGARRHFFIEREKGRFIIQARNIYTEQLVKRAKRKTVREWIERRVSPRHSGKSESRDTVQTWKQKEESGGTSS